MRRSPRDDRDLVNKLADFGVLKAREST